MLTRADIGRRRPLRTRLAELGQRPVGRASQAPEGGQAVAAALSLNAGATHGHLGAAESDAESGGEQDRGLL